MRTLPVGPSEGSGVKLATIGAQKYGGITTGATPVTVFWHFLLTPGWRMPGFVVSGFLSFGRTPSPEYQFNFPHIPSPAPESGYYALGWSAT